MSLNFKVSFDLSDFEDDDFLQELRNVYNFYNNVIVLEYKLNKEKKTNNMQHLKKFIKQLKIIIFNLGI
jgi:hypothetical protein